MEGAYKCYESPPLHHVTPSVLLSYGHCRHLLLQKPAGVTAIVLLILVWTK
jgi:hypothetical protein